MKKHLKKITRHIRLPKVKLPFVRKHHGERATNKQRAVVTGLGLVLLTSLLAYLLILNPNFYTKEYSEPFRDWLFSYQGRLFLLIYFSILITLIVLSSDKLKTLISNCLHTLGSKLPKIKSPLSTKRIHFPKIQLFSKAKKRLALRYSPSQNHKRKKRLMVLAWIVVILTPLVVFSLTNHKEVRAWWNDHWQYRQKATITNSGTTLTDFQVEIALSDSAGKTRSDCADIRVMDTSHNLITDPYWVDCGSSSSISTVWIKFGSIPNGDTQVYVYYGNPLAVEDLSTSGENIFDFFDDFDGTSIDSDKWTTVNGTGITVSGGVLKATSTSGWLESITTFDKTNEPIIEAKWQQVAMAGNGYTPLSTWISTSNTWGSLYHPGSAYLTYYRNDGAWTSLVNTNATNVIIKLIAHSDSTADIYYYDASTGSTITSATGISNSVDNEPIRFIRRADNSYTGQGMDARWDWIRSRKYDADVSIDAGIEESAPTPIAHWKFDEGYSEILDLPLTVNEQQINITNQEMRRVSTSYGPTDNSLGIIHWDANEYPGATVYFEADLQFGYGCGSCYSYAALYTTGGSQVASSIISEYGAGYTRVRSGAITLTDDTDYTVRIRGGNTADYHYMKSARLIVVQSNAEKLTDTETQIEVGSVEATSSATYKTLDNKKIYYYDSSKFSPAPTAYFEAAFKPYSPGIEQQINILDKGHRRLSGSYGPTDNSLGIFHWDADKYNGATVYFEAVLQFGYGCASCYSYAALYTTGGSQVASSIISEYGAGYTRVRSGAITLTDDTDYTVRIRGGNTADYHYIKAARLVIVQQDSIKITDTETQIDIGDNEAFSSSTYQITTDEKHYYYDSGQFSPAPTAYFEATFKPYSPTIEQQINIIDNEYSRNSASYGPTDNSYGIFHWDADKYPDATVYLDAVVRFGYGCISCNSYVSLFTTGGSQVSGSEIYKNGGGWGRIRSGALTLTDDTDYTIQTKGGNTADSHYIRAARLIIVQQNATKITETETQIEVGDNSAGFTNTTYSELNDPKIYMYDDDLFNPTPIASFSASIKIDSAGGDNVYAELYNKTNSTVVAEVSHSGDTNWTYVTADNIQNDSDWDTTNDDDYVVRIRCSDDDTGGCSGNIANAKIVHSQASDSGITDVETVQQEINSLATDADATYSTLSYKNQYNPINLGSISAVYYEATMKTSAGTGYARLLNRTDGLAIANGEISTASTSYTRVRGGTNLLNNLPLTPDDLDTQLKNSATNTTSASNTWVVIQHSDIPTSGYEGGVELYNLTDTASVGSSEVTASSAEYQLVRSSSITLTTDKEYQVRAKQANLLNARIVLTQSAVGGITDVETVHQQVIDLATDADTTYTSQSYINQYDLSTLDALTAVFYESTMKTSAGTGYARLINRSDGYVISNSEISTTGTTYSRVRGSVNIYEDMPYVVSNIDTQLKNSATNTTSATSSWLVMQFSGIPTSGYEGAVELYNKTDTTTVSGSEITSTDNGYSLMRSSSITLATDKEYEVRIKQGFLLNAKIVLDQTDADGVKTVEVVHQIINNPETDSDTGYTDQDYIGLYTPSSNMMIPNFNTGDVFYESTMKTTAGTGYSILKNDSDGTTVSGSEVTTTNTDYERKRSSSLGQVMPTANKNMDTQIKNSATNTTTVSSSSLIIQNSNTVPAVTQDSTLNNHFGGIFGASWKNREDCLLNNCLGYDGTDDYVAFQDHQNFDYDGDDSFTVSVWFKRAPTDSVETLIAKYYSTTGSGGYKVYMNDTGTITAGIDDDNSSFPEDSTTSSNSYDDGRWHNVAMVKNGTSTLKLYIDGQLVGTDAALSATGSLSNTDNLYVGIDGDGASNAFEGYIDEVKVYPYARSVDEIKTDAIRGSSPRGSSGVLGKSTDEILAEELAIHWKMDETSANTCDDTNDACDSSGNYNHARWEDNASSTSGKFAGAIDFDGTNDRVATSSANAVPFYSGWWNGSWSNRKKIVITNNNAVQTDFQLIFNLDQEPEMKSGLEDLRFVTNSDILLKHYVENTPPGKINVWVKVDTLAANSTTDIFMYYGNSGASSVEDRDNTIDTTNLGTYNTQYYDANIVPNHGASSDRKDNFYISSSGLVNRFNTNWTYQQQYGSLDLYTGLCYDDQNERFYGIDWTNKQWSTFTTSFTEIAPMDQTLGDEPIDCATDSEYVYTNHRTGKICRNKISDNTKECIDMDTLSGFDWGGQGLTYMFGHLFAGTTTYGANTNRVYMIDVSNWSSPSIVTYFDSSGHTLSEVAGLTWKDKYIYQTDRYNDYANEWQGPVKVATNEPTYEVTPETPNATVFSVSAWINADTLGATDRVAIARDNSGGYSWAIYNDSGNPGKLAFTSDGEANTGLSNTTLSTGSWYHVVLTVRGTSTKLYINGVLDKEIVNGGTLPGTGNISVGADPAGTDGWDGKIDEVRIYNKTLSAKEAEQLYKWAPSPIVYYPFDENTGTTTVYDRSGNNNHGTMNGSMTETDWVQGKIGGALDFDGTDDYLTHNTQLPKGAGTISHWVKPAEIRAMTSVYESDGTTATTYNGFGNAADILEITYALDTSGEYRLHYQDGTASETFNIQGGTATVGEWAHVAVSWDRNGYARLYVNGTEVDSANISGISFTSKTATQKNVGRVGDGTTNRHWKGLIDELYIYDYVRTPEQITENMNAGHPAPGSPVGSPILHLKMDDGYGDAIHDSSPQSTNGNLAGACPGVSTCPSWTNNGKMDKALSFDGGDYAGVDFTIPTTDFTYSTWVYMTSNTDETIVNASNGTGGNELQLYIDSDETQESGKKWRVQLNNTTVVGNSTEITSNTWHHLVFTREGSSVTFYLDDNIIDTGINSDTLAFSTCDLLLGIDHDTGCSGSLGNGLNGTLDELKVYNFALNSSQVKTEFNQGKPVVYGALSTDSSGNASNSGDRAYCPPGDSTSSCAPIAEWKMDEGTGSNTYDTSANNNTGTISESVWAKGIDAGWSQEFDGTDDYIDVGTNSSMDVAGGDYTISAWAKWTETTGNGRAMVEIGSFTDNYALTTGFGGAGQDKVGFAYGSNTWKHNVGSGLNDGNWHYIVGVMDTGTPTVYIDGVSRKLNNLTYTFTTNNRIGEGGQDNFGGQIDLVRIYNYARTQEQVAWDYNHGKPLGWWKFDECTGTTAYDSGTGENNGTITEPGSGSNNAGVGVCSSGSGDEMWNNGTTGKLNSSLDFDGTDDYMATSGVDIIAEHNTNTKYVSFGAWVKPATSPTSDAVIYKNNEFRLTTTASDQPQCELRTGGVWQTPALATNVLPTGSWSHVFCTYDGSDIRIYVNGVVKDTEPETGNILSTNGTSLTVGRNPGDTQYFDGQIDDVRVYNYGLTSQQVKTVINEGAVRFGPATGSP